MLASFAVLVPAIDYAEGRQRLKQVFLASIVLTLASLGGFLLTLDSVLGTGAGLAAFFIGFNVLEALLPSLASRLAPRPLRGTAIGVYSSIQLVGIFLGGAVGGILAQTAGLSAVLWFGTLLTVAWLWPSRQACVHRGSPPRVQVRSIRTGCSRVPAPSLPSIPARPDHPSPRP